MSRLFENRRYIAPNFSKIVVCLRILRSLLEPTYNATQPSSFIGLQPDELDQMRCIDIERICEGRLSVHGNWALPPNPKRNHYVNHIRRKIEEGIGQACRKTLFCGWGAS